MKYPCIAQAACDHIRTGKNLKESIKKNLENDSDKCVKMVTRNLKAIAAPFLYPTAWPSEASRLEKTQDEKKITRTKLHLHDPFSMDFPII